MLKKSGMCLTVGLCCVAMSSYADQFFGPSDHRGYASIDVGIPYINYIIDPSGAKVDTSKGVGGAVYIGDEYKHLIGPELGVQYNTYYSEGSMWLVGLTARLNINFSHRFNGFLKLGYGFSSVETCQNDACGTQNTLLPVFGAGLGMYVKPNWLLSAEMNGGIFSANPTSNASGVLGITTVGLTYFFDL